MVTTTANGSGIGQATAAARPTPPDYAERVYAGVLGKLIGVYLGRPFEGWTYDRIMAELGEVDGYVHERRGKPLVVTDDDITGTFTFLRALEDHGAGLDLTPAQVGETWLNYVIERRTIFWWGGLGNSTEHTAYLRLKHGLPAPASGATATNGQTIAEQIGAQIFVDGWGMVAPGDPELAADLARRAASVSHDGAAIHGAQVIAAMEAQAFVEPDLGRLLDTALGLIPPDSVIRRLVDDLRGWHAAEPDWRRTRERIAADYGYDTYRGPCHMVPNHALIHLALLYGGDDFRRALTIVNTAGWDTDCNSGNVGCLLGIKNGLAGIDGSAYDWRGPVGDRMYLPTADGGRAITDALTETYHVVNAGRALAGEPPLAPKGGARFHFTAPGSVQGFAADPAGAPATVANAPLPGVAGEHALAIRYRGAGPGAPARATTATFVPPDAVGMTGYQLVASPTLFPGQTVSARVAADPGDAAPATVRLVVGAYGPDNRSWTLPGPEATLAPGEARDLSWRLPAAGGYPVFGVGLEVAGVDGPASGTVYLDRLGWAGTPTATLGRPEGEEPGDLWRRAWVAGVDQFEGRGTAPYRIVQNEGTGLISQGTREWEDVRVEAPIWSLLMRSGGIAVRVQGLRRYYALLVGPDGVARLVKARDGEATLAEAPLPWEAGRPYSLALQARGTRLDAWVDGRHLFGVEDAARPLLGGGVGLVCSEGCLSAGAVTVTPAS